MTVTTKFNIDDIVYAIYDCKLIRFKIFRIAFNSVEYKYKQITYFAESLYPDERIFLKFNEKFNEYDLFKTKEEALQALVKKLGYEIDIKDLNRTIKVHNYYTI